MFRVNTHVALTTFATQEPNFSSAVDGSVSPFSSLNFALHFEENFISIHVFEVLIII